MESPHSTALIEALTGTARTHRHARKLLVARTPGEGREVLRALTAHGVSWLGFEVTTTWQLAQRLVGRRLVTEGIRVIDAFDHAAILDESIDTVLQGGGGRLAALMEGPGLRKSIATAVRALRLAGIDAAALARTRFHDEDKRLQLSRIMLAYERQLDARSETDVAGVFRLAVASLLAANALHEAGVDEAHVFVLPGLSARGLQGQLVDVMLERGAILLPSDPVHGLAAPPYLFTTDAQASRSTGTLLSWLHDVRGYRAGEVAAGMRVELFAATSVAAELREVLRRAMSAGLHWDEIEIVTTDPLAYGAALDSLAQTLEIPVTYAAGLPVTRTRPGRAVAQYLEWIRSGLSSDVLREMLERGDLGPPPGVDVSGVALARRLRRMRVGRSAAGYTAAFSTAEAALVSELVEFDPDRSAEELAAWRERERIHIAALRAIIEPLLAVVPDTGAQQETVDVGALATGALIVLQGVPRYNTADATAHARLTRRLERVASTATRPATPEAAIAAIEESLDTRVPAPDAAGGAPWGSAGGHIYLSDLDHGGYTGRRATFVTGLDALRFPGGGSPDALLVDEDRHRLAEDTGGSRMPDAAERAGEKRYRLAMLLSRLRGEVYLSYSAWDAMEGRAVAPAAELLQAYRLVSGDASADYDAMHGALSPAASPVPSGQVLDSDDAWLHALAGDSVVRDGRSAVFSAFPSLAAGFAAGRRVNAGESGPHIGVLQRRAHFDPRNSDVVLSATRLQTLGTCAHRYMLQHILGVRRPEDREHASDAWLTPGERGSLLHRVFDRTLRSVDGDRLIVTSDLLQPRALDVLDEELGVIREIIPPPGEAVLLNEAGALREDVRAWCAMMKEDGPNWVASELVFGRDGTDPVVLQLPGGTIRLRGSIDRIDRLPDGTLRVVDYKTGGSARYTAEQREYDGGRRLQHVLYAAAAEQLLGEHVSEAEFQFPSRRSENHRATFGSAALRNGLHIVDDLLSLAAEGRFYPTNDANDCRWCELAPVCRVRIDDFDHVTSPRAEWWKRTDDPGLRVLYRIRGS